MWALWAAASADAALTLAHRPAGTRLATPLPERERGVLSKAEALWLLPARVGGGHSKPRLRGLPVPLMAARSRGLAPPYGYFNPSVSHLHRKSATARFAILYSITFQHKR